MSPSNTVWLSTYLGRSPALGKAKLKMIFHCSKEVLKSFCSPVEEALQKRLLEKNNVGKKGFVSQIPHIFPTTFENKNVTLSLL